ncbi:GNAT family N-acetyltransferase [Prosthecomicrobium pneumaticum]|uniref:Putative N-acetyltransferase YhbS n=1 Tax=Prosthecomicrobium pneumaticum TaxID=81895 RepID=A0A7W9CVJ1_9HYPH|nr:N-acetyltransferase [Prosthecomicrobium pneumaticum]MBB5752479.1 putative N-acetyltransferase YhbS [Prosthecomicrobium pneumaticum]
MVLIEAEAPDDWGAREALLDRVMGEGRFLKSSERLREGRLPSPGLALVARDGASGELVGTVRLWDVSAGGRPALMLGPLAVADDRQGEGIGGRLMRVALTRAAGFRHDAVILVGDAPYYARFGFSAAPTRRLQMPGPVDPDRFLALELTKGALDGAAGMLRPTGAIAAPFAGTSLRPLRRPVPTLARLDAAA